VSTQHTRMRFDAVVLGTSSSGLNAAPVLYESASQVSSANVGSVLPTTSVVLCKSFASTSSLWRQELDTQYRELGETLSELRHSCDEDFKVDESVYNAASRVAAVLASRSCPAPKVFTHGPKSAVFSWEDGSKCVYLTVSANHLSALVSTAEQIKQRIEFSTKTLQQTTLVVAAIESAQLERPVLAKGDAFDTCESSPMLSW
jgi:hypothetical protein